MSLSILLVAATDAEADAFRKINGIKPYENGFLVENCDITLLVTGIGTAATSWSMEKWFSMNQKPDLAVNIGIAGSYNESIGIGAVVIPVSDCFSDRGTEVEDIFIIPSDARSLFKEGRIYSENKYLPGILKFMKPAAAVTVNRVTDSETDIEQMIEKFNPDIETMESATFFYICSRAEIPFLAIRSISNMVGPRDKNKWDIPLALNNLSERLKDILLMLD